MENVQGSAVFTRVEGVPLAEAAINGSGVNNVDIANYIGGQSSDIPENKLRRSLSELNVRHLPENKKNSVLELTVEEFKSLMRGSNNVFSSDVCFIVDSDLDLTECENVILPPHLCVRGDLRIGRKSKNVPEKLCSGGIEGAKSNREYILSRCNNLGNADLKKELPGIEVKWLSLPDNLVVDGNFVASNYQQLIKFGHKTLVNGNCEVNGCENLESLGNRFEVPNGSFSAAGCRKLKMLSDTFLVKTSVNLSKTGLISFPENKTFEGTVDLANCVFLIFIGKNVSAKDIVLSGCIMLESWPENMSITRSIYLDKCPVVKEMPEKFEAKGDLVLSEGPLNWLKDLKVKRHLIIKSTEILNLGEAVKVRVGGNIDLTHSPMKSIPAWLFDCFMSDSELSPHHIFLKGTGLTRAKSGAVDSNDIKFHFDDDK
ncbi:hypothetical protein [Endozoicomonas sp.]|uniref:hypothetical protein n=1 Tax=Endozoicomonas sp. TaxID=1892382 RepID=UPI00288800AA|nr:hypothetical protein [Endozoicomonas sp.]